MKKIDEKDTRGYTPLHRAFQEGNWEQVRTIVNKGAKLNVLTPAGASLKDFAEGIGQASLYQRLKRFLEGEA